MNEMNWELFYYDEVFLDIREAKKWYREQQQGLDKRFVKDVKASVNRLQSNPLNYELI